MAGDRIQARKEPVQARSRARFERILAEAVALLSARGVDAVSMSEIAANANISIASLYQYFPDKAAIVATLAERYNQAGQACVRDAFAGVNTRDALYQAAECMADEYYAFFRHEAGAHAIWQASQADARLRYIDAEDMAAHTETVATGFQAVAPDLAADAAMQAGRLITEIIATAVRSASEMADREGNKHLHAFKALILRPAIDAILAG